MGFLVYGCICDWILNLFVVVEQKTILTQMYIKYTLTQQIKIRQPLSIKAFVGISTYF